MTIRRYANRELLAHSGEDNPVPSYITQFDYIEGQSTIENIL